MSDEYNCAIDECNRETPDKFCIRHQAALVSLEEAFSDWVRANGEKFTRKDYLTSLLDETINVGSWVREVAELLLKTED